MFNLLNIIVHICIFKGNYCKMQHSLMLCNQLVNVILSPPGRC